MISAFLRTWLRIALILPVLGFVPAAMAQQKYDDQAQFIYGVGSSNTTIIDPTTNRLFVGGYSEVEVFDMAAPIRSSWYLDPIAHISLKSGVSSFALDTARQRVYTAGGRYVTAIDTQSMRVVGTYPAEAYSIAVNTKDGYVYAGGNKVVFRIKPATDEVTAIPVASFSGAIAVNSLTNHIYSADLSSGSYENGTITDIDGATLQTSSYTVGQGPTGIAVNPLTNMVYVANGSDGSITTIDATKHTTATLKLDTAIYAVTVDQTTNRVYASDDMNYPYGSPKLIIIDGATSNTPAKINSRIDIKCRNYALSVDVVRQALGMIGYGCAEIVDLQAKTGKFIGIYVGEAESAIANPVTGRMYTVAFNHKGNSFPFAALDMLQPRATRVAVGQQPRAAAVDGRTGRVFVANSGSNTVSVINGTTNAVVQTVAVGSNPLAIASDLALGDVLVANSGSNNVTVLDAATSQVRRTVAVGNHPEALVVDQARGRAYVLNGGDSTLSILDGSRAVLGQVRLGAGPHALALDQVSGAVFATNQGDNTVTMLKVDGTLTVVPVGRTPRAVVANPRTKSAYTANSGDGTLTRIDQSSGATSTITGTTMISPTALTVDAERNWLYVADASTKKVTAMDGDTHAWRPEDSPEVASFSTSTPAYSATDLVTMAVNVGDGHLYTAHHDVAAVSLLDETMMDELKLPDVAKGARAIAVNPLTNVAYVVNGADNSITVLAPPAPGGGVPDVSISAQAGGSAPTFRISATAAAGQSQFVPERVYYQLDSTLGVWSRANQAGAEWQTAAATVAPGPHVLYAYASDGRDASSSTTGYGTTLLTGRVRAYPFVVTTSAGVLPQPATQQHRVFLPLAQ